MDIKEKIELFSVSLADSITKVVEYILKNDPYFDGPQKDSGLTEKDIGYLMVLYRKDGRFQKIVDEEVFLLKSFYNEIKLSRNRRDREEFKPYYI